MSFILSGIYLIKNTVKTVTLNIFATWSFRNHSIDLVLKKHLSSLSILKTLVLL